MNTVNAKVSGARFTQEEMEKYEVEKKQGIIKELIGELKYLPVFSGFNIEYELKGILYEVYEECPLFLLSLNITRETKGVNKVLIPSFDHLKQRLWEWGIGGTEINGFVSQPLEYNNVFGFRGIPVNLDHIPNFNNSRIHNRLDVNHNLDNPDEIQIYSHILFNWHFSILDDNQFSKSVYKLNELIKGFKETTVDLDVFGLLEDKDIINRVTIDDDNDQPKEDIISFMHTCKKLINPKGRFHLNNIKPEHNYKYFSFGHKTNASELFDRIEVTL